MYLRRLHESDFLMGYQFQTWGRGREKDAWDKIIFSNHSNVQMKENHMFEEFLEAQPHFKDSQLLFNYYSREVINTEEAKLR